MACCEINAKRYKYNGLLISGLLAVDALARGTGRGRYSNLTFNLEF